MSVCSYCPSTCISSAPTGQISIKFYAADFYKDLFGKIKLCLKSDKNIVHFAWRCKYVLFLSATHNCHKASLRVQHIGQRKLLMYNKFPPSSATMRSGGLKYTTLHSIAYIAIHKNVLYHIGYVKTANTILYELWYNVILHCYTSIVMLITPLTALLQNHVINAVVCNHCWGQTIIRPMECHKPCEEPYKYLICLHRIEFPFPLQIQQGNEISFPHKHKRFLYVFFKAVVMV